MHLAGLWRYPVKSLGAEPVNTAELTADGLAGDRLVHVRGPRGPLSGRTRSGLLTIPASTGPDGEPLVAGHRWDSTAAADLVTAQAGPGAELVADAGPGRFDVLPLLVATDGAVEAFGYGLRRLRPNLLIAGVRGDAETTWPGQALRIGEALIGVYSVRQRCIVTTIDPDTGAQDLDVLRHLRRNFGSELALNCWVIRPGTLTVGDPVTLEGTAARPDRIGGWILGYPYPMAA